MATHTQLIKQKQIEDHVNTIGKWRHDVNGQNHDDALGFIFEYLHHLTLCIFHLLKILYPLCILNPYKYESNFLNSLLRLYVKVHINMNLTFQFFYRGCIL